MNKILVAALIITAVFAALLAFLIIRRVKRIRHAAADVICIILAVFAGLSSAAALYFSDYYHALPSAQTYLSSSSNVAVSYIGDGILFDGPGSDVLLIFYPGAKVEYTAYAPLMFLSAEKGADCYLAEMPFNFAFFGIGKADDVIGKFGYERYYVGGHSLGGVAASAYCAANPENVSGLILAASYPATDIDRSVSAFSIYGSRDTCMNMENYTSGKVFIRGKFTEFCIEGGNHAQFGDYGRQDGDMDAAISPDRQWEIVSSEMCKFMGE